MCDDLVKRLRDAAKMSEALAVLLPHSEGNATAKLYNEAADAIEELSKRVDESIPKDDAEIIIAEVAKPRWIPVTERLPEKEKRTYWICTDTGYQCECRWTNNRFGIRESDEWGWSIFDITQYQEAVAWMPLPKPYEPPEEET